MLVSFLCERLINVSAWVCVEKHLTLPLITSEKREQTANYSNFFTWKLFKYKHSFNATYRNKWQRLDLYARLEFNVMSVRHANTFQAHCSFAKLHEALDQIGILTGDCSIIAAVVSHHFHHFSVWVCVCASVFISIALKSKSHFHSYKMYDTKNTTTGFFSVVLGEIYCKKHGVQLGKCKTLLDHRAFYTWSG